MPNLMRDNKHILVVLAPLDAPRDELIRFSDMADAAFCEGKGEITYRNSEGSHMRADNTDLPIMIKAMHLIAERFSWEVLERDDSFDADELAS